MLKSIKSFEAGTTGKLRNKERIRIDKNKPNLKSQSGIYNLGKIVDDILFKEVDEKMQINEIKWCYCKISKI